MNVLNFSFYFAALSFLAPGSKSYCSDNPPLDEVVESNVDEPEALNPVGERSQPLKHGKAFRIVLALLAYELYPRFLPFRNEGR